MPEESIEVYEDGELIIHATRWGTYQARDKHGNNLCSGPFKEDVIFWGRNHLFGPLPGVTTTVTNTSFNDGYKL